jgi:ABC-2 type transport system permease protein
MQRQTGYVAVVTVFMLTLLLAGQAVGMLAEEKSNKVIEILAAAVPLEAVFLGKLVGMFGVALLFVAFWSGLLGGIMLLVPGSGAELAALEPSHRSADFPDPWCALFHHGLYAAGRGVPGHWRLGRDGA